MGEGGDRTVLEREVMIKRHPDSSESESHQEDPRPQELHDCLILYQTVCIDMPVSLW